MQHKSLTRHLLYNDTKPRLGGIADVLIHRNKYREVAKMRRQRNMPKMKEQGKSPEKELNQMEVSNLLDTEFKTMVIKYLMVCRVRMD